MSQKIGTKGFSETKEENDDVPCSPLFPGNSGVTLAKQIFICLLVDPYNDPLRLHFELLLPLYKWLAVCCLDARIHFTVLASSSSKDRTDIRKRIHRCKFVSDYFKSKNYKDL